MSKHYQQCGFGGGGGGELGAVTAQAGQQVEEEHVQALKERYGFDKPIHIRYYNWLKDLVTLDLGESWYYEEPVLDVVVQRFPVSLTFGIISLLMTYLYLCAFGYFEITLPSSFL